MWYSTQNIIKILDLGIAGGGERDLRGLYFTVIFYAYAVLINVDEPLLVLVMTIPHKRLTTFTPRI